MQKKRKEVFTMAQTKTTFEDYDNIIYLDIETSGFDAQKDRIIELAYVAEYSSGCSTNEDFIRLPEGASVPEPIAELTGITDEFLEMRGVAEEDAARTLLAALAAVRGGRTLIVAHNAKFVMEFIRNMFARYGEDSPLYLQILSAADCLDTQEVFMERHPGPHKFSDIVKAYYLDGRVSYSRRAIDDCKALHEVCRAMREECNDQF